MNSLVLFLLLAGLAGGAFWYFKFRKQDSSPNVPVVPNNEGGSTGVSTGGESDTSGTSGYTEDNSSSGGAGSNTP